jgi:hypothetical protein
VITGLPVGPPWACRRRVLSKPRVANGVWSEDWMSWALQRKATREAGNRAATTFRSGQWRDSVPERFPVNNSAGLLLMYHLPFLPLFIFLFYSLVSCNTLAISTHVRRIINSFRGRRHLKGLPVRGQRTRTNNRTSRRQSLFLRKK